MKVEINVEKRHIYFLTALIVVLFGIVFAIAQTTTIPNPGHSANEIGSGTMTGPITINGDLSVSGQLLSKPQKIWSFTNTAGDDWIFGSGDAILKTYRPTILSRGLLCTGNADIDTAEYLYAASFEAGCCKINYIRGCDTGFTYCEIRCNEYVGTIPSSSRIVSGEIDSREATIVYGNPLVTTTILGEASVWI